MDCSPAAIATSLVISPIGILYTSICFGLVYSRKNFHPLNSRPEFFLYFYHGSAFIYFIIDILSELICPCGIYQWLFMGIMNLYFMNWLIYGWRTVFLEQLTLSRSKKDEESWFFRNRRFSKDSFLLKFLIAQYIIYQLIVIIIPLLINAEVWVNLSPPNLQICFKEMPFVILGIYFVSCIIYIAIALSLIVLLRKGRTTRDGLLFKRDTVSLLWIWGIAFILWVFFTVLIIYQAMPQVLTGTTIPNIAFLLAESFTHLRAYFETRKSHELILAPFIEEMSETQSNPEFFNVTFPEVYHTSLKNHSLYHDSFKEFLISEYAIENFLFIEAVDNFENIMDPKKKLEEGKKIYNDFVREGAPYELNLFAEEKTKLEDVFLKKDNSAIPDDVFLNLKIQIIENLQNGSYQRFLNHLTINQK